MTEEPTARQIREANARSRARLLDRRAFFLGVILALGIVVIALSIFGLILRSELNDARARLAGIETSSKFAQVATCYASARGRPQLFVILRGIAVKLDPTPRAATLNLVDKYEAETPTVRACDRQALLAGFKPSDFPPPKTDKKTTGR